MRLSRRALRAKTLASLPIEVQLNVGNMIRTMVNGWPAAGPAGSQGDSDRDTDTHATLDALDLALPARSSPAWKHDSARRQRPVIAGVWACTCGAQHGARHGDGDGDGAQRPLIHTSGCRLQGAFADLGELTAGDSFIAAATTCRRTQSASGAFAANPSAFAARRPILAPSQRRRKRSSGGGGGGSSSGGGGSGASSGGGGFPARAVAAGRADGIARAGGCGGASQGARPSACSTVGGGSDPRCPAATAGGGTAFVENRAPFCKRRRAVQGRPHTRARTAALWRRAPLGTLL